MTEPVFSKKKKGEGHPPYLPAEYKSGHALALQKLSMGEATPDEQKIALQWIIDQACMTYELSYRPESDRDTVFAEGRRFAGLQIVKLLHINTMAFKEQA